MEPSKLAKENAASEALLGKFKEKILWIPKSYTKLSMDDPRRLHHALKVAFTITLVSFIYYSRELYHSFKVNGIWAVITVVVVTEFTAGATISRGLNRGVATFLGGTLGYIVAESGRFLRRCTNGTVDGFYISICVAIYAAWATFTRFIPKIKARYDYGTMISLLTFCMVAVTGYKQHLDFFETYWERFATVLIGGTATMMVSVLASPVWAGEDLHESVSANLETLAKYLDGFGSVFFQSCNSAKVNTKGDPLLPSKKEEPVLVEYKLVLNSKGKEDILANFASWEPMHGRFGLFHPWEQYVKIGAVTRECASLIDALNYNINSDIQPSVEFLEKIEKPCKEVIEDCSSALKELAACIFDMRKPEAPAEFLNKAEKAIKDLKATLKISSMEIKDLLAVIPPASVASILIDIVKSVDKILKAVTELSVLANFKAPPQFIVEHREADGRTKTTVNTIPIYRVNLLPRQYSTHSYPDLENGGWE